MLANVRNRAGHVEALYIRNFNNKFFLQTPTLLLTNPYLEDYQCFLGFLCCAQCMKVTIVGYCKKQIRRDAISRLA